MAPPTAQAIDCRGYAGRTPFTMGRSRKGACSYMPEDSMYDILHYTDRGRSSYPYYPASYDAPVLATTLPAAPSSVHMGPSGCNYVATQSQAVAPQVSGAPEGHASPPDTACVEVAANIIQHQEPVSPQGPAASWTDHQVPAVEPSSCYSQAAATAAPDDTLRRASPPASSPPNFPSCLYRSIDDGEQLPCAGVRGSRVSQMSLNTTRRSNFRKNDSHAFQDVLTYNTTQLARRMVPKTKTPGQAESDSMDIWHGAAGSGVIGESSAYTTSPSATMPKIGHNRHLCLEPVVEYRNPRKSLKHYVSDKDQDRHFLTRWQPDPTTGKMAFCISRREGQAAVELDYDFLDVNQTYYREKRNFDLTRHTGSCLQSDKFLTVREDAGGRGDRPACVVNRAPPYANPDGPFETPCERKSKQSKDNLDRTLTPRVDSLRRDERPVRQLSEYTKHKFTDNLRIAPNSVGICPSAESSVKTDTRPGKSFLYSCGNRSRLWLGHGVPVDEDAGECRLTPCAVVTRGETREHTTASATAKSAGESQPAAAGGRRQRRVKVAAGAETHETRIRPVKKD